MLILLLIHEFVTWNRAPCKVTHLSHVLNFPFCSKERRLRWERCSLKDINYARHESLTPEEQNITNFAINISNNHNNSTKVVCSSFELLVGLSQLGCTKGVTANWNTTSVESLLVWGWCTCLVLSCCLGCGNKANWSERSAGRFP